MSFCRRRYKELVLSTAAVRELTARFSRDFEDATVRRHVTTAERLAEKISATPAEISRLTLRPVPAHVAATAGGSKLNQRDCMQADWTRVWPSI